MHSHLLLHDVGSPAEALGVPIVLSASLLLFSQDFKPESAICLCLCRSLPLPKWGAQAKVVQALTAAGSAQIHIVLGGLPGRKNRNCFQFMPERRKFHSPGVRRDGCRDVVKKAFVESTTFQGYSKTYRCCNQEAISIRITRSHGMNFVAYKQATSRYS